MKPILFNDEMVRAILAGRKTKTRRPLKPQPEILKYKDDIERISFSFRDGKAFSNLPYPIPSFSSLQSHKSDCPFGQVGDRLWVRETFCLEHQVDGDQPPSFHDGRPILYLRDGIECSKEEAEIWLQPHYRATDPTPELAYEDSDGEPTVRWKPPLHMPRWASRITLEITDIRIERVQEITEEEAEAEGVLPCPHPLSKDDECLDCYLDAGEYACSFLNLWNGLYAKQGLGVDVNPWVWVMTFRRVEGC